MLRPKFIFRKSEALPVLAWLAVLPRSGSNIEIFHGRYVEVCDRFFIEGAWAGAFSRGELSNSECVFGSGGQIEGDLVTFVPSTATTDFLYYYVAGRQIYVSNSLPLILGHADDSLDETYTEYAEINVSIVKGISQYIPDMPTQKRHVVSRLLHKNIEFRDGALAIVDKPLPPRFSSFAGYEAYLRSCVGGIIANARESARVHPLHIYSTQSKGYDSTAINSIACDFGVDAAFTVRQGKANNTFATNDASRQVDDDGSAICALLGIKSIALDRREFANGIPDELYYWAGMHISSDFNLCGMTPHIVAPALLLTGNFGEVWYTKTKTEPGATNDELIRGDTGGHGLTEIRLKVGFSQVAIPYIGGRSRADILQISESDEMAPWRLGVPYDRPIPRRLAEDAGVRRDMFGQRKMASVVEFPRPNLPFGDDLKQKYLEFLRTNGLLSGWKSNLLPFVHAYNTFASYKGPSQNIYAYYADRLISKASGGRRELRCLWQYLNGSIYCFAVNTLALERQGISASI